MSTVWRTGLSKKAAALTTLLDLDIWVSIMFLGWCRRLSLLCSVEEKSMAQVVNKRKLNASDLEAIGRLLVEVLGGNISHETRQAILELGDPREIPPPYGQLVGSIQESTLEGKELAHELQEELRVISVMLLEQQI